jgi:hypothetical protein
MAILLPTPMVSCSLVLNKQLGSSSIYRTILQTVYWPGLSRSFTFLW